MLKTESTGEPIRMPSGGDQFPGSIPLCGRRSLAPRRVRAVRFFFLLHLSASLIFFGNGGLEVLEGRSAPSQVQDSGDAGRRLTEVRVSAFESRPRETADDFEEGARPEGRTDRLLGALQVLVAGLVLLLGGTVAWGRRAVKKMRAAAAEREQLLQTVRQAREQLEQTVKSRNRDLMASQVRFAAIVESAFDAIIVADADQNIVVFNSGAQRIFGYDFEEALGKPLDLLLPEDAIANHRRHMQDFLEASANSRLMVPRGNTVRGRRKNGESFMMETSISVIKVGGQQFFSAIARDVTDRVKDEFRIIEAQETAEQARRELEIRNAELQVLLTRSEELAAAAQVASQAKMQFLATISHELRTPMNGIMGYLGFLEESHLSSEQRECVNVIGGCANSLLGVINDLLDFSNMEEGNLSVETVEFSMRQAADEVADKFRPMAQKKGIELVVHSEGADDYLAWSDPDRSRQVLTIFLANALKFTEQGHVAIQLSRSQAKPGEIRCTVADTGIGIPTEKHALLFERFSQVDQSHTRRFGGTGLGLAIAKRLLGFMGGSCGFSSELGRGSVFWFVLPAAPATPSSQLLR